MNFALQSPHPQLWDAGHNDHIACSTSDFGGAGVTRRTMNNDMNGGVSKRSLLLLGGLAALSLNPDLRRKLVLGTRDALGTAQAGHAGHVAQAAAQSAVQTAMQSATHTLETLREEVPPRAQALLGNAQEAAGVLAAGAAAKAVQLRQDAGEAAQVAREEAGKRLTTLSGEVMDATAERREAAAKALSAAQATGKTAGSALIADVSSRVQGLLSDTQDTVEGRRHAAEKTLARARKDAEKELRAARREWKPEKLESAVAKRIAPLHKQAGRELAQFEKELHKKTKQAARSGRQIEGKMKKEVAGKAVKVKAAKAKAMNETERSSSSGVVGLVLLATGAIVLARIPVARQGILNAVESINPGAAQGLKNAGRSARNLIGTMWLERMEEEPKPATPPAATAPAPTTAAAAVAPAAGAAADTQGATTGATWGGAIAPDSAAAGNASNTTKPSSTDANKTN
jgi:flagellar biosynthesis/type III secretory pathway protein FliH